VCDSLLRGYKSRQAGLLYDFEFSEKKQLLGFCICNCVLNEKTLSFTLRFPFNLVALQPDDITMREWLDAFRTVNWKQIQQELYLMLMFLQIKTP
jgi:hypothetical protein